MGVSTAFATSLASARVGRSSRSCLSIVAVMTALGRRQTLTDDGFVRMVPARWASNPGRRGPPMPSDSIRTPSKLRTASGFSILEDGDAAAGVSHA